MIRLLTILSLSILILSCSKEKEGPCFKGAGEQSSLSRNLNDFNHLVIENRIDVELVQGSQNQAIIFGGKHLIPQIKTEIRGDTLFIYNANRCNFLRSFEQELLVELEFDQIRGLTFYGGGEITCRDTIHSGLFGVDVWDAGGNIDLTLNTDTSYASIHNGPADITYQGESEVSYSYSAGYGTIDLSGLNTSRSLVNSSGTSQISVRCTDFLNAQIYYIGDVIYYGNPTIVEQQIEGTGELIDGGS